MEKSLIEPIKTETIKLEHGCFYVHLPTGKKVIKPLSQVDLANGWRLKLPKKSKKQQVHHYSISLAQLPPYLWYKINKDKPIVDRIYIYTIQKSEHNDDIILLFNELKKQCINKDYIKELYMKLNEKNINGWIMLKALYIIKN